MNELNYPNGPWVGFYVYSFEKQNRHRMDIALTFSAGNISGSGSDDLGKFGIVGKFDAKNGECHWHKSYVGLPKSEMVFYKGFREGNGIWGTWEITFTTGGFRIWPKSLGDSLDLIEGEKKKLPEVKPVHKAKILITSVVD